MSREAGTDTRGDRVISQPLSERVNYYYTEYDHTSCYTVLLAWAVFVKFQQGGLTLWEKPKAGSR